MRMHSTSVKACNLEKKKKFKNLNTEKFYFKMADDFEEKNDPN